MPEGIEVDDVAKAYDAQATVTPETFRALMAEYLRRSEEATADLPGHTGVVYDEASGQRLDVWGVGDGTRPAFFVVHGGYWKALSRQHTAFMARVLADAGIATVAIDYGLAPATPLAEIVRQTRAAFAFVRRHGAEVGADPDRIVVGGSSAGAHLAAMTMVDGDWADVAPATEGLLLSGLFDLRPLVNAPPNAWLKLTPESAAALSPALASPTSGARAVIACADGEASGFTAQTAGLAHRWSSIDVQHMTIPHRNHFDVFMDLADAGSALTRAVIDLVAAAGRG